MLFDEIYRETGEFGKYQMFMYCILGLVGIPTGWQNMAITFIGADMDSWCKIDALHNLTASQQKHVAIPIENGIYSRCKFYDLDYNSFTQDELEEWNRTIHIPDGEVAKTCNEYVYDRSLFTSTIVSQWNLVCGKKTLVSLVQTIYMSGFLTGCITFGQISDIFGRRKSLIIALITEVIFALGSTFCPIYWLYCALRFVVGLAAAGAFTTYFVLIMEIIGIKYRMVAGIFVQAFFAIGLMVYPWMSYGIRDHIHLQLLTVIFTATLWLLFFVIPESPRWLVTHGRDEEAEQLMRKMAKVNGTHCPDKLDLKDNRHHDSTARQANLSDLFRRRSIRKITMIMWFCWFVISLSYYGLSLGVDFLKGSLFLNSFLAGAVELPAYIIICLIMDRTGRKWPTIIGFILVAIFCISCMPILPLSHMDALLTVFLLCGKSASAGVFAILYVYAAELFPTVVRNVGVGSSSMCARISGLLQPQVANLRSFWVPLPFLVYGATSLIAGITGFTLPETLGKKLPETLDDVEMIHRKGQKDTKSQLASTEGGINAISMDDHQINMKF